MKDLEDGGVVSAPRSAEPSAVVAGSARRLAVECWLLAALPAHGRDRARTEWREQQVAMVPLGTHFSAVRLPGRLVRGLARSSAWGEVDAFLREDVAGPVICDPRNGGRYYALVPARLPVTWKAAAEDWRHHGVDVLGSATLLGVPRVGAVEFTAWGCASYWSSPMAAPGELCEPLTLARFIAAGAALLNHGT